MKNNYNKILQTATELMSTNGYHGTSIKMIADKVGITKSGVLHHFKSKEDILVSIVNKVVHSAIDGLLMIVKDNRLSGREKLKKFIHYQLQQLAETGGSFHVYLREARYFGEENKRLYRQRRRIYGELVKEMIEQIEKESSQPFEDMDPTGVTNAILGMCNWIIMWYSKNGKLSIEELADQYYKILEGRILKNH